MAVLTQSALNSTRNVIVGSDVLAAYPKPSINEPSRYSSERLLQISSALQTSLELQQLIETFAHEVKVTVPVDGVRFQNLQHDIDIKVGRNATYQCAYHLTVNEQALGEVAFMRKSNFTPSQNNELELLLRSLVHPLRNALMYRTALLKAQRDPLTGVYNRAALTDTMARDVELAQRHRIPLSIIVLDIDHFKNINDSYGHVAGDCLLKGLVECANHSIRRCDMLFRYGGEEFVVLLNNTDEKGALRLAERIRRNVEKEEYMCGGQAIQMTLSAGVAQLKKYDIETSLFE
ncbi:MAG: GGDEF domain-containing protein, partial [Gammaproteobacteria bacterium]|nr:GGDEF domain-containing protein [Gammaproteobacteria bacterium]